jgi:DNA mismatch repair protein MutS
MLIDDYINYTNKYREIYDKCLVLIQVGSFYELYGIPDKNEGANVDEVCEILEIQSTRKNKSEPVISKNNPKMAGIPLYVLNKYVEILIENNYTIILVEQVTLPPNPKREVTRIISPSTFTELNTNTQNNFLMCIYFTSGNTQQKNFLTGSVAFADINTNDTYIFNCEEDDTILNIEDIQKTIYNNKPKEIIVITDNKTRLKENYIKQINNFMNIIPGDICTHKLNLNVNEAFFKLSYQKTILEKVFSETGLLSVIEFLDLEMRPLSIVSFTYLLQFCYEHSNSIIKGIKKPVFLENEKYLALVNNALENLDIIPRDSKNTSKTGSLLNLLNNCKTSIGKRYFKHCLINPLIDFEKIKERYEQCDFFIKNDFYAKILPLLGKVCDLERLFKRILMKTIQPSEISNIYHSFTSLKEIYNILNNNNCNFNKLSWSLENQNILEEIISYFENKFNITEIEKVNLTQISKNIFNKGIYSELDIMENELIFLENIFENICLCLNENNDVNEFKLESNKDNIKNIIVTKNRYNNMIQDQKRVNRINKILKEKCNLTLDDVTIKSITPNNKTVLKIIFKNMYENQSKLNEIQENIRSKIIELYLEEIDFIIETYSNLFLNINKFISKVDFYSCNAKNAITFCYTRPEIYKDEYSYIKANDIRHPLIEQINNSVPYITNDVELGTKDKKGMLLYGINSSGKSSYMKSIGMNIIMAQAGMYVSSKKFMFSPYKHIFSRIVAGDNIHKKQSTYVAEINEIRTILKRSTNRSLVLGDELLSSTETKSAISIIASGINTLSNKETSFLFASHLHELCELEHIKKIKNVNIYHLSVEFDVNTNSLIYNRKLKEGNGNTLYGLEVAKSLDLPIEFLLFAEKVRDEYMNEKNEYIITPKVSKYNKDVFIDKCDICGEKTEEIHHIVEQQYSNEKGIIEHKQIHKNRKSNLINVCCICHDKIHNKEIVVNGYIETSKGIKLDTKKQNLNYDEIELQKRILSLKSEGKTYNKIFETINNEFTKITMYKIKKIISLNK